MAKETFVLNSDLYEKTISLSDEELGKVMRKILLYVKKEELPKLEDKLEIVFDFIKFDIDKNEKRYEERCEQNKKNGEKGGAPKGNTNAKKEKQPKQPKTTETTENNMTHHNHIHSHNQDNKKRVNKGMGEEERKEEDVDDTGLLAEACEKIISHLNEKTDSNYRSSTKTTKSKINARLNEGYTLDDFIVVINKKTDEWKDTEFEQNLNPDTLFGNKFEKYLNQKINKRIIKENSTNPPNWFNKKSKTEEMTQAEKEELEKILSEM